MKPSSKDTRTSILDIAEQHFALNGFAGTSLRGIIKDAGVNVAAVAYHFGTKEDLYQEVVERFSAPVVRQQLTNLHKLNQSTLTMRDLLHAFYEPPIYLIKSMGTRGESLSLFLGRAHLEPEPVYSLVDKNYAVCRNAFIQGFRQVTPGLTEPDYQWRFEFMLSLIVCFLTRQTPIRQRCSNADDWQPADVLDRLIEFCSFGMTSNKY